MIRHPSKESIKFFGSVVAPENGEALQRTKTEIENSIKKILNVIQNERQSTDGSSKLSPKETKLVGLIQDLQKKHLSLYALYDRVVTEEFEKVLSFQKNKGAIVSSSDSDSEYFSSEEVDVYKRRSEKVHHNLPNISGKAKEALKTEASTESKELERKLTSLKKEMEGLRQKKKNLELGLESQTNEVKQLSAKNTKLQEQVLELEKNLKDEKGVKFDLQEKIKKAENMARSNAAKLRVKINELEQEAKTLQKKKKELEEQVKCYKNEVSTLKESSMDKFNLMQQKLDSLENENKELEAEMERQRAEISQQLIQIENLKDNLVEMRSLELNMQEEQEGFLEKITNLELELETRSNQKTKLEEQLGYTSYENKQLVDENKTLQDRNQELRTAITQRGEEISEFIREHENRSNGASMEVMTLKAEVNAMRLELDTLHEQKNKLEQQNERIQKEYSDSIAKMETLNAKLTTQIADQEETIEKVSEENKQAKVIFNKLNWAQRTAERKMEELAEKFRKKMEDNIRLLHQRIHVAEQLNNENKNSCRRTKERYEEENKVLGEKVAKLGEKIKALEVGTKSTLYVPNGLEFDALNALDLAVEEQRENVVTRVEKIKSKVELVKGWVKEKNGEVKELREKVNRREEEELLLREKVWNLEARVSKEGGEKLNLTKAVHQLEKRVVKLEKSVKEKDEELLCLGEKKREAIRQLCFVVDFHRDRCNYLRGLLTNNKT
ncbi:hypothetical protein RJT34_02826 [Clitoria ternatea]|uniref:NAB domain-containing protein n=1 Tax=Clitoria ternatea TaxID=43366 RepID=A0AAN9KKY9_CLITE